MATLIDYILIPVDFLTIIHAHALGIDMISSNSKYQNVINQSTSGHLHWFPWSPRCVKLVYSSAEIGDKLLHFLLPKFALHVVPSQMALSSHFWLPKKLARFVLPLSNGATRVIEEQKHAIESRTALSFFPSKKKKESNYCQKTIGNRKRA